MRISRSFGLRPLAEGRCQSMLSVSPASARRTLGARRSVTSRPNSFSAGRPGRGSNGRYTAAAAGLRYTSRSAESSTQMKPGKAASSVR